MLKLRPTFTSVYVKNISLRIQTTTKDAVKSNKLLTHLPSVNAKLKYTFQKKNLTKKKLFKCKTLIHSIFWLKNLLYFFLV